MKSPEHWATIFVAIFHGWADYLPPEYPPSDKVEIIKLIREEQREECVKEKTDDRP